MSRTLRSRSDEGAVSVFAVMAVTFLVLFVGVAVDLSGALHTRQRAQDVARQAARAGAQAAHSGDAVRGNAASVDPAAAVTAARAYLSAVNVNGTVSSTTNTVTVRTNAAYTPVLLTLAGIGPLQVTGQSSAQLQRALVGVRR